MSFTESEKMKITILKGQITSYYNLQMKKLGNNFLTSLFYDDCIITGGCIASLYHDEPVNDIDVYAKTEHAISNIRRQIGLNLAMIKVSKSYDLDDTSSPTKLITDNATTLTNDVQFIHLGTAENCRKNFDFIHCMPWYDIKTQKLYISEAQFHAIRTKTLIPNISGEKIKTRRVDKYAQKGWDVSQVPHAFPDVKPVQFNWNDGGYEIGIIANEMKKMYYTAVYDKSSV